MAIGDRSRSQNAADYAYNNSNNLLNNEFTRQQAIQSPFVNNYTIGAQNNLTNYPELMGYFNQFRNPGAAQPSSSTGSQGNTQSFGNLSDPSQWMNLVGNSDNLKSWIRSNYPNMDENGVNYYAQHIQEKPGANPTEQAGSAQYWLGRMPEWLQQNGGGGGNTGTSGATNDPFYNSIMNSLGGYGNFAQTGGFSPQDVQDMRARMISPIRAIYSQANADIDRQRRLQHGISPNYTAAKAKMARDQAYATSDATTNANAALAQLIQSGKLSGLGGLGEIGGAARGQNLQSLTGQTNLYGQTPGLMTTTGNQLLGSEGQAIDLQKLRQALDQSKVSNQLDLSKLPSNTQQALGNIAGILGLGSQVGSAISGIPGLGSLSKYFPKPSSGGGNYGA